MKIEEKLRQFYEDEINSIEIPSCPVTAPEPRVPWTGIAPLIVRISFAACIALAFIPLIYSSTRPTTLAARAAETCRTYDLNSRITSGLLDFHKIASESISSGGKK